MDQSHPLNDAHAATIQNIVERCAGVMKTLTKAHDCGIDISEPLAVIQAQLDKAQKYKQNFFPHLT